MVILTCAAYALQRRDQRAAEREDGVERVEVDGRAEKESL